MKVFTLSKNGIVIAISESKRVITNFALQNNLYTKEYALHKFTGESTCENILIILDEYYVHEIENNIFIRSNEIPILNEDLYRIKERMKDAEDLLWNIDEYINIPKWDKKDKYSSVANMIHEDIDNINIRNVVKAIYKRIDLNPDIFCDCTVK